MPIKKSDLSYLRSVVNGDVALDQENPSFFNRLFRWYEQIGVRFYGDPDEDYEVFLDHLASDIGYGVAPGGSPNLELSRGPYGVLFLCYDLEVQQRHYASLTRTFPVSVR